MDATGHLTSADYARYWERTLAPATLLELSDHLQECAACREKLRQRRPSRAVGEPVAYEELIGWIETETDPLRRRELAERIAASPAASAEVLDLLRFREEASELPARDHSANDLPAGRSNAWMALAAGLAIGFAFLIFTTVAHRSANEIALVDHGKKLIVRQDGSITGFAPLPDEMQRALHDAALFGRAEISPAASELRGVPEMLAGATKQSAFYAESPAGTVIATARPTFRWSAAKSATGYRVNFVNQKSGTVISSPVLGAATTSWQPNDPLLPNEIYQWEVEALRDGRTIAKTPAPPEPEARFRVLDPADRATLERGRKKWANSHLLMGILDARLGLIDDARAEFAALARENPGNALPRQLLASLTNPGRF